MKNTVFESGRQYFSQHSKRNVQEYNTTSAVEGIIMQKINGAPNNPLLMNHMLYMTSVFIIIGVTVNNFTK